MKTFIVLLTENQNKIKLHQQANQLQLPKYHLQKKDAQNASQLLLGGTVMSAQLEIGTIICFH